MSGILFGLVARWITPITTASTSPATVPVRPTITKERN